MRSFGRLLLLCQPSQKEKRKTWQHTTNTKRRHAFCYVCRIVTVTTAIASIVPIVDLSAHPTVTPNPSKSTRGHLIFPLPPPPSLQIARCPSCWLVLFSYTDIPKTDTPLFLILLFTSVKITIKCDNKFHASC